MDQEKLRELENQCIQEHAPPCTAACPIHVDVRGVLAEVMQGNFDAALQTLTRRLPFPGIIGRVCEQPCREVCNRRDVGDALATAALERACADFGKLDTSERRRPRRGKRVAVIGGGLSGATAARDLARKGHTVVLFEATERLGGALWELPEAVLPRDVLQTELENALYDVEVRLNSPINSDDLASLHKEFDAIYLGVGSGLQAASFIPLLQTVDPVSFATEVECVFAGGRAITDTPQFITSVSTGRRAATSIGRYVQKVSLTASRENEGSYTTRLYTNTEGFEPLPVVPMATPEQGYTREEAIHEAGRCLLCECMECVKVCAYLEHYGSYPKQYVRQIYNNLSIVMGTRQFNTLINSCSLCGLCGEVCPEDLNMATVCREARQLMVKQDRMPPSAHDFALRDMAFSNGPLFALARHAPGTTQSDYAFFPGCQLSASAPAHVTQMYAYLQQNLPNVGLMLRCCGAPADWAGRKDLFEEALAAFRTEHARLGQPKVILACSTCYQMFKEHLPEIDTISLWELMDAQTMPEPALEAPLDAPLAIHDPCTTRYEHAIHDSVRSLLHKLGYHIEELPLNRDRTECCSYGGLMWLANRELAQTVVEQRIAQHPNDYVTYCAMCRDFFAGQGKGTLHLLDLFYEEDLAARAGRPGPGYSQRHENRMRLKRQLLQNLWGETMEETRSYAALNLRLSEAVQERIDDRLILEEDIQQVIQYAEQTGNRLLNPETGHFLAYYKPVAVTYWVEYTPEDDGFTVHNAYSHRMEVVIQPKSEEASS